MGITKKDPLFRMSNWCEWTLRDDRTGKVVGSGRSDNVYTTWGLRTLFLVGKFGTYLILSDDEHAAGLKNDFNILKLDGKTPDPVKSVSGTFDTTELLATYSATYTAPSSPPRIIRKIGFGHNSGGNVNHFVSGICAYMDINPPIVQEDGVTLELVYRQQFIVATEKSARRWQSQPMLNQRRFIQQWMNMGNFNSLYTGYCPLYCFGEYFFVDEGARYGLPWMGTSSGNIAGANYWAFRYGTAGTNYGPYASAYISLSLLTSSTSNNSYVGAFTAAASAFFGSRWNADDSFGGDTEFLPLVGFQPLAYLEGDISSVFKHPAGETYFYNTVGSVALSQGNVVVKGPYRPDNRAMPGNLGVAVRIGTSGGTGSGTEATYKIRTEHPHYNGEHSGMMRADYGTYMKNHYTTWNYGIDPDVRYVFNSICYDGRGSYWFTRRGAGDINRLCMWKGFTPEQVLTRLESDDTRFYGITPGDQVVQKVSNTSGTMNYGAVKAPPCLCSNGDGLVYFPTRRQVDGEQAIYVIDNTKPGRYYQRPTGSVATGSTVFTVSESDEIHGMFPFVAGDVGKKLRIVNSAHGNDGVRAISAVTDARTVVLDGTPFATEGKLTWHWVVVTRRDASNGLADRPRVLKYDKARGRLWAWTDSGIQLSLDDGATWTAAINDTNDLTTALANKCAIPDGRDANNTCCVGNAGELYWMDDGGGSAANVGLNKYVGTGPGGTHTRIPYSSFTGYDAGRAAYCMNYDPVAPDLPTKEGALWIGACYGTVGFWRLKCDSFTVGNMQYWLNPSTNNGTVANLLSYGVQFIHVGPGGAVSFNSVAAQSPVGWNYAENGFWRYLPIYYSLTDTDTNNIGSGVLDISEDGAMVHVNHESSGSASGHNCRIDYSWEPTSQKWVPWLGTDAQFNAYYGVTNGGWKTAHSGYELFKDNLWLAFQQDGGAAQSQEFVANESFTFITSLGVHRTNVQDVYWYQDTTVGAPVTYLEVDPLKTVPANGGAGNVRVYFGAVSGAFATAFAPTRQLGASGFPEVVGNTGRRFCWMPHRYPYAPQGQNSGELPNVYQGTAVARTGWLLGIDLGAAYAVSKLKFSMMNAAWWIFTRYLHTDRNQVGRFQLYYSDDNVTWTEVTEVKRFAADGNMVGSSATLAAGVANEPTLNSVNNMLSSHVGHYVKISNAANAANNGTFRITAVNGTTSVRIYNPDAVLPEPNTLVWAHSLNPEYKYTYSEVNSSQNENSTSSDRWAQHFVFDLEAAGVSEAARTHRYWKCHVYTANAQLGTSVSIEYALYYVAAYDAAGMPIGLAPEAILPGAADADAISTPVRQACFIQDRVGLSGKGGINTVPSAYADGYTDLVTIASGTFDTASINPTTDYLAYRHPDTGTFARAAHGPAMASGVSTQVKITAVSATTIQVDKRVIPDNLSGADWEVRRMANIRNDFAYDPGDMSSPFSGGGVMSFHDADAGREFRIIQRTVNYRP